MSNNGKTKVARKEHPKNQIDVIANTVSAISDYAALKKMSFLEASQVLILNELRCIHWHYDFMMQK